MIAFIARKIASGAILLLVISSLAYFLMFFSSGNIARTILGDTASLEQIAEKERELGLDRPILERYMEWIGGAVQGDFGVSWQSSQPIFDELLTRVPVTLTLVILTIIITALIATALGMFAAVKGGIVDRLVQVLGVAGFAIPNFVIAIFLVSFI
ncbi:MAG: hypothetical protein RIQ37_410, partial [Actinomycetota bacterium]